MKLWDTTLNLIKTNRLLLIDSYQSNCLDIGFSRVASVLAYTTRTGTVFIKSCKKLKQEPQLTLYNVWPTVFGNRTRLDPHFTVIRN